MQTRTKGRIAGITFLIASALMAEAGPAADDTDPVIDYGLENTAMIEAQQSATDTLPRFLAQTLDAEGMSRDDAGVKVAFQTPGGRTEVIWVSPFAQRGTGFAGILANSPAYMDQDVGDLVTFQEEDIRDWYVLGEDGRMYGSYTTRVMLTRMSPDRAEAVQGYLSFTPLPAGW